MFSAEISARQAISCPIAKPGFFERKKRTCGLRRRRDSKLNWRMQRMLVLSRPSGQFVQQVTVGVGSSDGVQLHAPVLTADGLVGQVTKVARSTPI